MQYRWYTLTFILLVSLHTALAAQSVEQIVVRMVSHDPTTNTYTFSCDIPSDAVSPRTWSVRPDSGGGTIEERQTEGRLFSTNKITSIDLYHLGCQTNIVVNGAWKNIRGDFHIELRPYEQQEIIVHSSEGRTADISCRPQETASGLVKWVFLDASTGGTITFFDQQRITYTVPEAGLWDVECDMNGKHFNLPVEYFNSGPAYVPNANGCIPGEQCPTNTPPTCTPSAEVCDSKDNDCDSQIDENNVCGGSACYNSVKDIPATCTGGSITQSSYDGCKHVVCSSDSGSFQIMACDKPSGNMPTYFEMYRQSHTGGSFQICLGPTCLKDNEGYAKSSSYPVCTSTTPTCTPTTETCNSKDDDCDGQVDENNVCTPPPSGACYNSVKDVPVTCGAGSVTQDTWNGCRQVTCSAASGSLQTLACDKSGFFEVYRQTATGTAPKVCFGTTCIQNEGYAKSGNFPICTGTSTCTPTTEVCDGADNDCDSQVDENNVCAPTSTCYNSVKDIPAQCTGASITSDTYDGCRKITCGSMQMLACDKSSYFEMYKQAGSGAQICLAGTCISDSTGFAKSSNFPICTGSTGGNNPPQAPTWIEPSEGKSDMDPRDFHIHVNPMVDPDGDTHQATDFEIWDTAANQRVWSSLHNEEILYHIHNADGTFEGRLAGKMDLENDRAYKVRARFYDSRNAVSAWSERNFRTKPAGPVGGSTAWTLMSGYKIERVGGDISVPVNIAMAPDIYGHVAESQRPLLYVTQLYGQVGMLRKDGSYKQYVGDLLNYDSFGSLPGSGEMGVTGLYVDPVSGDLYVSYVYYDSAAEKFKGRVEKFVTNDNGDGFTSRQIILNNIPVSPAHQVQQITRGPDGKLYLSTGDADDLAGVQDPSKMNGKILRFNEDGSMPSDNPWAGTYTWAMGFRNMFGTDWRPGTQELWTSSNGPDSGDGIFKLTRGFTGNWKISGSTTTGTWYVWPKTVAPTAVGFDKGQSGFLSDSNGKLYVALSGSTYSQGPSDVAKRIQRFTVNGDGSFGGVQDFLRYTGTGYSAPIGLAFGKDGLYFTDMYGEAGFVGFGVTKGAIYRISPGTGSNPGNTTTEFSAGLGPARWYPKGLEVVWECKGIGGSGQYVFNYQFGDGQSAWNVEGSQYHKYPSDGTYTASCQARDKVTGKQASATTTITLTSGVSAPPPDDDNNTCANSVKDVQATCTGGTISSDTYDGCRKITCGSMQAMACDKGSYFEVYKQSGSGVTICLANACVSDSSGFAKSSNFPICSGSTTTPPPPPPSGQSASVAIAEWYPKGREYAFNCNTQGYTATSYSWSFGDGTVWPNANKDAYYTYSNGGSYTVSCTASGSGVTKTGTMQINVS